jgi:DNA-binding transcriptional regulator YiaG
MLNTRAKRRTKLGRALEQSAKEILAHVEGHMKLPTRRIILPDEVDVRRIRTKAGMSQAEFARVLHQPENAAGMGAGAQKTRRNDARPPRGHR